MQKIIEIYHNENYDLSLRKDIEVGGYTTFTVIVKTHEFSGAHPFCMTNEDIKSVLLDLKEADKTLSGEIKLTDNESESFILFSISNSKVAVNGELGFCSGDNFLKFVQRLDQTVIRSLYNCLCEFLD